MMTLSDLHWVLGEQNLGPLEFYFAKAAVNNGISVNYINIHSLYSDYWKKFSAYSHRLPRMFDNSVQHRYFKVINDKLIGKYNLEKPSCVFIYNDCKILPETISYFKSNGTKIIVFLGDDPNYLLPAKKTFLLTVMNADKVIVPDSGWIDGLKMLDLDNIIFSPVGTDTSVFYPFVPDEAQLKKYQTDILFVGTGYFANSWGIKRASVLNELCGFSMKLFGDKTWFELFYYFPELKKHFTHRSLNAEEVNIACNCAKLYPVTVNSGVSNGVSTRVFDCIASGIFVIAEYKKDINTFFPDSEVVCFTSKRDLRNKAEYYLKNEKERKDHSEKSLKTVREKYNMDIIVKNILEQI